MNALSPYPEPRKRDDLFLIIDELHHPRQPVPAEDPEWLTIPQRALFTGIAVFGAIGSGKTTCCMYPLAIQILAFRSTDPERRAGGLVL